MDAGSAAARLGQTIDRYRLEGVLGEGGFGAVYRARHIVMDRPVALKLLHFGLARSDSIRERFLREAQVLARLHHPHVVGVHDCGITNDGEVFLAMELLAGEDLAARLHRHGRLDAAATLQIVDAVLEGLAAAHDAGIIHRDLKPANVFLAREGDLERPKLVDFGISKRGGDADRLTKTGALLGTPVYMAPETFSLGTAAVDARADLYAVGVMLFEMLSGRLPYDAPSYEGLVVKMATEPPPPLSHVATVSSELAALVDRALAKSRDDRFPDARAMQRALAEVPERRASGPLALAGTLFAPESVRPPAASSASTPSWSAPTGMATPTPLPVQAQPTGMATPVHAPVSQAPVSQAPVSQAPVSQAPVSLAPQAPVSHPPVSQAPVSHAATGMAPPGYGAPSSPASAPSVSSNAGHGTPPTAQTPSWATPPRPATDTPTSTPSTPSWGAATSPSHTPMPSWSGSASTSSPVPVPSKSSTPWGWIALALLIPAALVGVVGVFVTTCQGDGVTDTVAMAPASAVPAPMVGAPAPVVTAPVSDSKPPIDSVPPVSTALRTPVEPAAPPSRVEPPARPSPVEPPAVPTPTAAPTPRRSSSLRLRPPRVVGEIETEPVYELFETRRGPLERCRGDADQVAHVSLILGNGRVSLARSNPNVDGSDTEAAQCVANVFRNAPLAGSGILMIEVELGAREE